MDHGKEPVPAGSLVTHCWHLLLMSDRSKLKIMAALRHDKLGPLLTCGSDAWPARSLQSAALSDAGYVRSAISKRQEAPAGAVAVAVRGPDDRVWLA